MKLSTATTEVQPDPGRSRLPGALLLAYGTIWAAAAIAPHDRAAWVLENLLVLSLLTFLAGSYRVFPLSDLSYLCVAAFLTLHTVGAYYSYPEVPLGERTQAWFGWERNHYDRLVHFGFGLLMAYPMREVILRVTSAGGFWAYVLPLGMILALSASYELLEWGAALLLAAGLEDAFLGTQGDQWDAHKDMLAATAGAVLAMTLTGLAPWRHRAALVFTTAPARTSHMEK